MPEWQMQFGNAFVELLDRKYRERLRRDVQRRRRHIGDLEFHEAWACLLEHVWKTQRSGQEFDTEDDLLCWLRRFIVRANRWLRHQRVKLTGTKKEHVMLYSEVEADAKTKGERNEAFMDAKRVGPSEPGEPSIHTPVGRSYAALSPKRREAIDLLILQDLRPIHAADRLGQHPSHVCENARQGLDQLRLRVEGRYVDHRRRARFDPRTGNYIREAI